MIMQSATIVGGNLFLLLLVAGCPLDGPPPDSDSSRTDFGDLSGGLHVTGSISGGGAAKALSAQGSAADRYGIVAVSTTTGRTYLGASDGAGEFDVVIPASEQGRVFGFTVLTPDGQAAGPVVFDAAGGYGFCGLRLLGHVDLGRVAVSGNASIRPGASAGFDGADVSGEFRARVTGAGTPVGVGNHGKGEPALGRVAGGDAQQYDRDEDGLVDWFDADDDGDGVVDDFDPQANLNPGVRDGLEIAVQATLSMPHADTHVFVNGSPAEIDAALAANQTLRIRVAADEAGAVDSVRVLEHPGPAFLQGARVVTAGGTADWAESGYALAMDDPCAFAQTVLPGSLPRAGDTLALEVTFSDGSTAIYFRMLDFAPQNPPVLLTIGTPSAWQPIAYDDEVTIDRSVAVRLEWLPPLDERGEAIDRMPYRMQVEYYRADGTRIEDIESTNWTASTTLWNRETQEVCVGAMRVPDSAESPRLMLQLPKSIFLDRLLTSRGKEIVEYYIVTITPELNGTPVGSTTIRLGA